MMRVFWRASLLLGLALLSACSTSRSPSCPRLPEGQYCLQSTTSIAPFAAQQKVDAYFGNRHETLLMEMEVDAAAMRLVGLTPFGQTLLQVEYDNIAIRATLPDSRLDPALIPALVQIALWPRETVQKGLTPELSIEDQTGFRRIHRGDKTVVEITYEGKHPPYQAMHLRLPEVGLALQILETGLHTQQ